MKKIPLILIATLLSITPFVGMAIGSAGFLSTNLEADLSQYWLIPDSNQTGLNLSSDFTLSMWINLETAIPNSGDIKLLIDKENIPGTEGYKWYLINVAGTPQIRVDVNDGNNHAYNINYTLNTSEWYHLSVIWNSDISTVTFYVNGINTGSNTLTGTLISTPVGIPFRIGWDDSPGRQFDGQIADVRVWSRAISSSEIQALYSKPCKFNNGTNLEGWWKFNGNGEDLSANNNDLISTNGAIFTNNVPYKPYSCKGSK